MHNHSAHVSLPEAWDEIQVFLTGPVLVAGAVPGLLFCVPGLIFFGAPVIIPLVLVAIVLLLIAVLLALLATPFLIVRALVRAHRRRTSSLVHRRGARLVARS